MGEKRAKFGETLAKIEERKLTLEQKRLEAQTLAESLKAISNALVEAPDVIGSFEMPANMVSKAHLDALDALDSRRVLALSIEIKGLLDELDWLQKESNRLRIALNLGP